MDLELTPDQHELRAVARDALDRRAPLSLARAYLDGAPSAEPLHELLGELGWYGVGLEEDDGFGVPGLVLLAEQVGAHAAPTALVDTAVAARVAAHMDGELAARVAAGDVPAALAVAEAGADWSLTGFATSLGAGGLHGEKAGVQHAATVGALLVAADADGELALALLTAGADGVAVVPDPGLDAAAGGALVSFGGARPSAALAGDAARGALTYAFAVGTVATAAEGLGAASAALDLAIAYAKEREQFGRPIGSFQALKHVMADAHVDREAAWSSVLYAAATLDEHLPDADETTAIAGAFAARASRRVVEAALQVLGGIAFTWEHDVHLLQRRVLACERRYGDALHHERRLGDRLAVRGTAVTA